MFGKIFGALGIARHVLALVILTGSTTALVAGSYDADRGKHAHPNPTEIEVLARMCLETRDPQSETCAKAIDASGLTADAFWAKLALSLNEQVRRPKNDDKPAEAPKANDHKVNTSELLGLVNACVASHERSSEPCAKALELSGLSADDFWAKVSGLFNKTADAPKTENKPTTTSKPAQTGEEVYALIKDCQAAYEKARQTHEGGEAVSQVCDKAIAATGLSANDFWAKFYPKPAATDQPKPTATSKPATEGLSVIIGACLAKFEAAKNGTYTEPISTSEACRKAFDATGLTPEQFYARFVQKTSPTPTAKPQPTQSVSDAELQVMVRDCFTKYAAATASKGNEELAKAAYEACTRAIAASGLTGEAFFAKYGAPAAPTN